MKKLFTIVFLIFYSLLTYGQLNGIKTIDPAGSGGDNYISFNQAITALNSSGTTSGVTFIIASGTYTEAAPLTIDITTNKPSSISTVTFKPANGATVVLNVGGQLTGSRWAIKLGTALATTDYIILDGSNSDGGTTRDWSIKSTATTYGIEPIDVYGDYCTIKNCIVDMNSGGYSGSGFAITLRNDSPTANNCTIENNKVTGNNAISIGRNTTNDIPVCLIKGNEIHCLNRGIYAYRSSAINIEDNEIIGDAYSGYPAGACYGIYTASPSGNTGALVIKNNIVRNLGSNSGTIAAVTVRGISPSGPGTYSVYNNKVYNLYNATTSSTGTPIIYGIQLAGGGSTSSYLVYNNFVSGLFNDDPDASASVFTYGIQYNTSGNANIHHNTVYISETTRDHLCAALHLNAGNSLNNIDIRNNIFYNSNTSSTYKSYSIYKSGSLVSILNSSDYNDLFVNGVSNSFVGYDGTADRTTLQDWKDNTPYDDNSKSVNVTFVSATDLHLSGTSLGDVNLIGTPLGAPFNVDIDGEGRHAAFPYIGADENDFPLPVELTSFTASVIGSKVKLNWQTATEINNYGFEVERGSYTSTSLSVTNWEKIGFISGNGNSNSQKSYSFMDENISVGKYSYRLKQIDNDGTFEFSNAIEVDLGIPTEFSLSQNYPNPFNPMTKIQYSLPIDAQVTLQIYSITGELLESLVSSYQTSGSYTIDFDGSNYASGTYIYRLVANDFVQTKKMTLVK